MVMDVCGNPRVPMAIHVTAGMSFSKTRDGVLHTSMSVNLVQEQINYAIAFAPVREQCINQKLLDTQTYIDSQ